MRSKTYEIEEVSKVISENHAKWHLSKSDQNWKELNIRSENFAKHIEFVLKSPDTKVFQAHKNCKDLYYHEATNTFVSVDLTNKHMGSCYRPARKEKYFESQKAKDESNRVKAKNKEKTEIKKGGYDALYKGKKFDRSLRNELLKKADRFLALEEFKHKEEQQKQNEQKNKEIRVKNRINILKEKIENKKRIADIEKRIDILKKDKSIDPKQKDEEIRRLEEELRRLKERQRKLEREKEQDREK